MKLELMQMHCSDGGTAYNLERTLKAIRNCAADSDIVVFPEANLTGFLEDYNIAELAEPLDGPSIRAVQAACAERNVAALVGLIERDGETFYYTCVLVTPEGVNRAYRKTHLWVTERGLVQPGDRFSTFEWRGVRIGIIICYDSEFPESAQAVTSLGAELILVSDGNMDPYGFVHRTSVAARAQENQVYAVVVNRVGQGEDGTVYAGCSAVVDPHGKTLLEAGNQECRLHIELDMSQSAVIRDYYDYRADQRFALPGQRIEHADGLRELLIP